MRTLEDVSAFVRQHGIEQFDLKFCDLWGRWHHLTIPASGLNERTLVRGFGSYGSSVGFKTVSHGDMVMVPDLETHFIDPFWDRPTLSFICRTLEADTRVPFPYDPRTIAQRAEAFLATAGIGDTSLWGPEFEFYVFNGVAMRNAMNEASYRIESDEGSWNSHELGSGYTMPRHGGYHAIPPRDRLHNLRSAITGHMENMGVPVKYHHHEVGGPGQCEIETELMPMIKAADAGLLIKYVARMVAQEAGLTATFMPKPLYGEAGSGMHFHQRLERDGTNLFYKEGSYANLSDTARWYIGGLLEHGPAVLALSNPSTNSYRRLVPGFEAPISAIYSLGNRSAAIRIPAYANNPASTRIEFRPPDATANPYLSMAAQLMAGIDGIRRKLDPTELGFGPIDEDIFSWPEEKRAQIKALPTSLEEAMDALEKDHAFLLEGDVFSEDILERWSAQKRKEQREVRNRPHPYEIQLYYDL